MQLDDWAPGKDPAKGLGGPPNPGLKVQPFSNFPNYGSVSTENVVF